MNVSWHDTNFTFTGFNNSRTIRTDQACFGTGQRPLHILTLSDFKVNSVLGSMVASTIIIALVFDSIFLPSMLLVFRKILHPEERQQPPEEQVQSPAESKKKSEPAADAVV